MNDKDVHEAKAPDLIHLPAHAKTHKEIVELGEWLSLLLRDVSGSVDSDSGVTYLGRVGRVTYLGLSHRNLVLYQDWRYVLHLMTFGMLVPFFFFVFLFFDNPTLALGSTGLYLILSLIALANIEPRLNRLNLRKLANATSEEIAQAIPVAMNRLAKDYPN